MILFVLWLLVGMVAVAYLNLMSGPPVSALEPALGRRIVVILILVAALPAFALMVLTTAVLEIIDGRDWRRVVTATVDHLTVELVGGIKEAWNGKR